MTNDDQTLTLCRALQEKVKEQASKLTQQAELLREVEPELTVTLGFLTLIPLSGVLRTEVTEHKLRITNLKNRIHDVQ